MKISDKVKNYYMIERLISLTLPQVKFVMSDIDGTILNDEHQVDSELKETLTLLKEKGIPFILASARSPKGIFPIARELGIGDFPMVCYNGAFVLKVEKENQYIPIQSIELDRQEIRTMIKIVKTKYPEISINLYSGVDWYVEKFDQWAKIESSITKEIPIEDRVLKLLEKEDIPIHKLLLIGTPEEIQQLVKQFNTLRLLNTVFVLSKENYLEVTNKEVSKEKALMNLAKYYHIPMEETMAIGDNYNDMPMLSLAGLGVAMNNAPDEVKKNADAITLSNNENGVSAALKKYVLKVEEEAKVAPS